MPWTQITEKIEYKYENECENATKLTFIEAINSALIQAMELDDSIFIMGQGINDKVGMFGMTNNLENHYGTSRVFDTPIAETGLAGIATGAAMAGQHPVYFHNRPDFLFLTFDQLINHASKYHFMSGGQYSVPLIMYAVTGQGWGSAAQHSQTIHGMLMHVPGIKIAMPTTPYDVKGILSEALSDRNPVVFLDHRRLHNQEGSVPNELYRIPFGKGVIRRCGKDITVVGISYMLYESLKAADELNDIGISLEVIDLRTIKPYDIDLIVSSVKKTGRLIVADTGWECCGVASEIIAKVYKECFSDIKCAPEIVTIPDAPTPAAYNLEEKYYKTSKDIVNIAIEMMHEVSN